MTPLVTYHANSFNNLYLLKNLLLSFEICNVYDNFEWVITDYGSTDGSRDFLFEMSKDKRWLTLLLSDEKDYFKFLESRDLRPITYRQVIASIFGKAINEARAVSKGDVFIHLATDHQFIRKGNWVEDMLSVIDHREITTGKRDISSILYRGLSHHRINKPNNERYPIKISENGTEYYVAMHKHYDDYHLMLREVFEDIGDYFQIDDEKDKEMLKKWRTGVDCKTHYTDYLQRTKDMGYFKVFLKYPYVVDFPNDTHQILNVPRDSRRGTICPIFDSDLLIDAFKNLNRPVSTDEILVLASK